MEVNVERPVESTSEPLAVRGTLLVLQSDPMNVLYRLVGASVVTRADGKRKSVSGARNNAPRRRTGDEQPARK